MLEPSQKLNGQHCKGVLLTELKVMCEKMIGKVEKGMLTEQDYEELKSTWTTLEKEFMMGDAGTNETLAVVELGQASVSATTFETNVFPGPLSATLERELESQREQWMSNKPFSLKLVECYEVHPDWFTSSQSGPRVKDGSCADKIKEFVLPNSKQTTRGETFKRKLRGFGLTFNEEELQFSFVPDIMTKIAKKKKRGKAEVANVSAHVVEPMPTGLPESLGDGRDMSSQDFQFQIPAEEHHTNGQWLTLLENLQC